MLASLKLYHSTPHPPLRFLLYQLHHLLTSPLTVHSIQNPLVDLLIPLWYILVDLRRITDLQTLLLCTLVELQRIRSLPWTSPLLLLLPQVWTSASTVLVNSPSSSITWSKMEDCHGCRDCCSSQKLDLELSWTPSRQKCGWLLMGVHC